MAALTAERAFLAELEGSCRTPIAGLARLEAGKLTLMGEVLRLDGSERFDIAVDGAPADAERLGREAGRDLGGAPARRCAGEGRMSGDDLLPPEPLLAPAVR